MILTNEKKYFCPKTTPTIISFCYETPVLSFLKMKMYLIFPNYAIFVVIEKKSMARGTDL